MRLINEQLHGEIAERQRAETALLHLNQELEDRVAKRTAEIHKSNEKLQKAVDAAESANRAKSDFLSNMSHELRTPLNHIIGFTELLLEQHFGELNDTQTEYLSDVLNSSKHLLSLINDILDLSKVEAGKHELYLSVVDLQHLLENSVTMIREKAQKHRIRISTGFENIPGTIACDERKIKQIMYNLLSNAVKFTKDEGNIHLRARRIQRDLDERHFDTMSKEWRIDSDWVEISVKDSGIGLKEEDQNRIFDPFVQADSAKNRKYQGTGLGLSLTKKLVELHSGCIWVQSDGEGSGADFRFVLPLREISYETDHQQACCSETAV